jgi:hypothetical protein
MKIFRRFLSGQEEQQAPADATGDTLGLFGKFLPVAKLDGQTPHEHACRCQFNDAIEAERDQHKASGCDASTDGNDRFNRHPSNREPFEPEGFTYHWYPV